MKPDIGNSRIASGKWAMGSRFPSALTFEVAVEVVEPVGEFLCPVSLSL